MKRETDDGRCFMRIMRSWMFVPGHQQRMIDKAYGLKLDVAMFDLEDGVPARREEYRPRHDGGNACPSVGWDAPFRAYSPRWDQRDGGRPSCGDLSRGWMDSR